MFGQNVIGNFENGVLIVSNAGNNEFFQQSSYYSLVKKYFTNSITGNSKLPQNRASLGKLRRIEQELRTRAFNDGPPDWAKKSGGLWDYFSSLFGHREPSPEKLCALISGRSYHTRSVNAVSASIYPLFLQAIQNNYAKGLIQVGFEYRGSVLYVTFYENGEDYPLPVGFDAPLYTQVSIHGEQQRIAVLGHFTTNEDDVPVLKMRISFLEAAGSRFIKIFFFNGKLSMKFTESPGKEYLLEVIDIIREKSKSKAVIDAIVTKADSGFLHQRIERAFEQWIDADEISSTPPDSEV